MVYGIKGKNTLPAGRRIFGHSDPEIINPQASPEVVRPGHYGDGQAMEGTPDRSGEKFPTAEQHNMALRGERYGAHDNAPVSSKSTKRYGHNPTTGAIQGSTGENPAEQERRQLEGAILARTANPPAKAVTETLGYFDRPTQPNTGHTTGGVHPTVHIDPRGTQAK